MTACSLDKWAPELKVSSVPRTDEARCHTAGSYQTILPPVQHLIIQPLACRAETSCTVQLHQLPRSVEGTKNKKCQSALAALVVWRAMSFNRRFSAYSLSQSFEFPQVGTIKFILSEPEF